MLKNELKLYLEEQLHKHYSDMGIFVNDKNPQIIELYNQARGAYDALDDLYFKLFHHYYSE